MLEVFSSLSLSDHSGTTDELREAETRESQERKRRGYQEPERESGNRHENLDVLTFVDHIITTITSDSECVRV